ncbi:MAG: T9SS C-terminal target domain-containing protein, partial [Bacteroidetes bacterium]
PGKFDVVYILAHELGHAHMLQHVAEQSKVMYPAAQTGTSFLSRILDQADINGGLDVMQFNSSLDSDPSCIQDSMEWFPPCAATNIREPLASTWEVFPNPAIDRLQLRANGWNTGELTQISLFSMKGQRVGNWQLAPSLNGLHTLTLPLGLSEGLYFLTICSDQQTFTEKIMIRHE